MHGVARDNLALQRAFNHIAQTGQAGQIIGFSIAVLYPKRGSGITILGCVRARINNVGTHQCQRTGKSRKNTWVIMQCKANACCITIDVRVDIQTDFIRPQIAQ